MGLLTIYQLQTPAVIVALGFIEFIIIGPLPGQNSYYSFLSSQLFNFKRLPLVIRKWYWLSTEIIIIYRNCLKNTGELTSTMRSSVLRRADAVVSVRSLHTCGSMFTLGIKAVLVRFRHRHCKLCISFLFITSITPNTELKLKISLPVSAPPA